MIKRFILSFLLGLVYMISTAQEQKHTVPFVLTSQSNISIEVILNKTDTFSLMFHTAVNEVSLIEAAAKRVTQPGASSSATAKSWGGESEIRYFENNHLQIGDSSWDSVRVWVDKLSGQSTDGKFGLNLFEDKIVEINFDKQVMVIHATLPDVAIGKDFKKFKLQFDRSSMFLEGELEIEGVIIKNKFLVHSGYGGTILLDDQFVQEQLIDDKLETISESQLRDSFGNVLITKKAFLPVLHIGGSQFKEIPISFFSGAIGRQRMSVLGSEILKRFNIFLDLQTGAIYLKPNELMKMPLMGS